MCFHENPSQSSNIVRPPICVFTSCEIVYLLKRNLGKSAETLVRTSSMTKVEANQSSTGMMSGSHFPDRWESLLLPCLAKPVSQHYRAWEWQLSDRTYPWYCWHCSLQPTKHDPAWQKSFTLRILDFNFLSTVLRGYGFCDILFVVHTKTVELCQDLHGFGHIPFSSSIEILLFYRS